MKNRVILSVLLCALIPMTGCTEDSVTDGEDGTGILTFRTLNPLSSGSTGAGLAKTAVNPPLTGDTTATHMTSLKLAIGDVWVSTGEVTAGQPDDLEWIRLTSVTNTELRLFEDYSFSEVAIPAGTYRSIKLTFRNVFYRYAQLISDPSVAYELLETMGSWTSPCDENDASWATTNYFGVDGNHKINDSGVFELVSAGERLGGFTIEAGRTASVSWRLGAGSTQPCINYLIDENGNLAWDCGIDRIEFECPPDFEYMWDFVVDYD